ncbi:MAG: alpha/beta hydrolase [Planctomycetes bacterium]|nr:alpha/beta hydrolase [Planctomycetota bacterium]
MVGTPERSRRSRRWYWALPLILLLALAVPVLVGCDGCFYYPDSRDDGGPEALGLIKEDVYFTTSDGLRLHGWFLPAVGTPRGMVLSFHGNAGNMTNHVHAIGWLPPAGYHVLTFDYRGYGRSAGRVTRAGTTLDGLAAVDYALTRPEYEPGRLFAYGQSMGGAVATVVAAQRPELRALVAEATFDSYRNVAATHTRKAVFFDFLARPLAGLLISAGHDPVDHIADLSPRPVLIIAAGRDQMCPPVLARNLYEHAREPRAWVLVDEADHFNLHNLGGDDLLQRILATFELGAAPPAP